MKKFFSFFAALLFAGSMMATEVTFTKDDFAGQGTANTGSEVSATKDGVTFTFSKGYCADESLRCYAHGALSITAEATIEKINFTTTGGKNGGLDAEVTVGATSYSVEDLASQARFTEIKVTLEGGEPVVGDTYTVAGSDAAIFGESWNPALTANDMKLADGVYTWAKAQLNLTAGDIEFKVVKNHSWDIAYPAQNYVVNIAEAGEYTLTITFDPATEAVAAEAVKKVIPQYEVAEAIAAGLAENDEILVRGIITKMEFKGKNFATYGSVNIYVADATGAEGAFEFYNCYSLNADTFRTSTPAYDAESTAWVEFEEVADENGNAIHVGDTVIAFGKYKLYSGTHELNTGCYLTEIKHPGDAPVEEEWAEIVFAEVAAAGVFNDSIFTVEGSEFSLKCVDTENSKLKTTSNNASFGSLDERHDYTIRLQTSGKSNSKNNMELNIPADGKLRIAVRTGSSSDLTRTLVLAQGNDTICNKILLDTDTVPGASSPKIFNFIYVDVKAGKVAVTYPINAINFYAFAFKANEPEPEVIWTVAGSKSVFGSEWSASDANNDMVKQEDGTYKWEKENITLAAGNVEFKVVKDHKWAEGYPEQNYQLAITEDGVYTISITFNAETKEITADATKTGEAEIDPTVSIAGSMNGWNVSADMMTLAEDKATASLTLNLAAQTYEFKVVLNGGDWRSNAHEFTRENATAAEMTGNLDNMHLVADVAGDYIFTWTFADNSLVITYPEAPVVGDTIVIDIESEVQYTDYVAQAGWWQFMAETDVYSISISNISTTQAAGTYTIADLDADYTYIEIKATETEIHFVDGSFVLTEGEDGSRTIEGVMTGDDGNIYNIKLVYRIPTAETTVNVEIPEWSIYDGSEYYGIASYVFAGEAADGTYVQIVIPGTNPVGQFTYDDVYARGTGIEVAGDYQGIYSMNITINVSDAGRAIITADILCFNNTLYHVTTIVGEGVDNIDAAVKAIKRIVNGQLVIEKAGKTYNINGAVIR